QCAVNNGHAYVFNASALFELNLILSSNLGLRRRLRGHAFSGILPNKPILL
ncbi:unnamed protein product, partial [Larinioides sclopetarius]